MINNQKKGLGAPDFDRLLKKFKINYIKEEIKVKELQTARAQRKSQEDIKKILKNNRHQRIVIIIDRSKGNKDDQLKNDDEKKQNDNNNDDKEFMYIYQLDTKSDKRSKTLPNDYLEETMSYQTTNKIIPNETANPNDLSVGNAFIGGARDIGSRNFVLSFHIHSEDSVTYEQQIKGQKTPFLPYHMLLLWPKYFNDKFKLNNNQIKKKGFELENIYKKWELPTNDKQLLKWVEIIDPDLYKIIQKNHLKYAKK